MNIILICLSIKYKGDWNKIYEALDKKERVDIDEVNRVEKLIKDNGWQIVTILDKEYPQKLKEAYKPPFVIWIKGDIKILNNKITCATGNVVDEITKERIKDNIGEIEKNNVLLIPDYKGADQEIMSLSKNDIVVVLACGINKYDKDIKGVLISEYPPDTSPHKDHYRNKNRIIASMSSELILFSSDRNGGINNLISAFLNLGKEIYCFPGDGRKEDGNSELIKQGASLITSIKDIS